MIIKLNVFFGNLIFVSISYYKQNIIYIDTFQISNGSRIMVVQFFPLDVKDLELPPPVGVVTFDTSAVLQGVVSDDSCRSEPCLHGGTCEVTWNDFRYFFLICYYLYNLMLYSHFLSMFSDS